MPHEATTQKLHKNIQSAGLDFADAVLDLVHHNAEDAPEDQERIDSARVYMHEVAGGDTPDEMPRGDILFTVGALLAALPDDQPGVRQLRVALMPALGALLDPKKPTRPAAKAAGVACTSSRPPGVPNSMPTRGGVPRFYRKRRPLSSYR